MPFDMATDSLHLVGLHALRRRWGWFLTLGIVLILLGLVAIGSSR